MTRSFRLPGALQIDSLLDMLEIVVHDCDRSGDASCIEIVPLRGSLSIDAYPTSVVGSAPLWEPQ